MHIISDVTCGPVPGSYDNARAEYDICSTPEVKHFITRKPCPPDNQLSKKTVHALATLEHPVDGQWCTG
ncbi:hypothetical protein Bpfe_011093, partial [Biomphalaria pfeifferi]